MAFGHISAWNAREAERERRVWDEMPEIWLGGPEGEAALIADVLDDDGWCEGDEGVCDDPYCCAPPRVVSIDTGGLT
jgi:hypothetical protein